MIQGHHVACRYVTSWHQGAGHMWFQTIDRIDCHPDCSIRARMLDPVANAQTAVQRLAELCKPYGFSVWVGHRTSYWKYWPWRDYSHARGDTARMSLDER